MEVVTTIVGFEDDYPVDIGDGGPNHIEDMNPKTSCQPELLINLGNI